MRTNKGTTEGPPLPKKIPQWRRISTVQRRIPGARCRLGTYDHVAENRRGERVRVDKRRRSFIEGAGEEPNEEVLHLTAKDE